MLDSMIPLPCRPKAEGRGLGSHEATSSALVSPAASSRGLWVWCLRHFRFEYELIGKWSNQP